MARSAASYILILDEQGSQAQNVLHTPPGVLHNTAFSDEVAPLCSAMKHLPFANMKHKRLVPLE